METRRAGEPRRTALPRGLPSRVYGDGVSFQRVSANPSDSESFLVAQPCSPKTEARAEDSGRCRPCGVSF